LSHRAGTLAQRLCLHRLLQANRSSPDPVLPAHQQLCPWYKIHYCVPR